MFACRREPFKVSALSGISCVKVSAGDNHTAALTATGEVGSQSSVLDIGFPMCVRLLGTDLVLGVHERSTDAADESGVAHVFCSVFSRLKFAKFARQLADLCQMIHERSHVVDFVDCVAFGCFADIDLGLQETELEWAEEIDRFDRYYRSDV
uniref:Uncharacterized protein n=1 Tax=Parascaris equorum TaxID=6256 RepID=A0A914SDS8_PAREQ